MKNIKSIKKIYTSSLLLLTKSFCNDEISIDDYKESLSTLCNNYRKELNINYGNA